MNRFQSSYEFTDAELAAWVTWFLSEDAGSKDLDQEVKDSLEQCLGAFFASAKAFEMHSKKLIKEAGIRCPKCHGRGHNNLYMAGSDKPGACTNCAGTGTIAPNMGSVIADANGEIDPMEKN